MSILVPPTSHKAQTISTDSGLEVLIADFRLNGVQSNKQVSHLNAELAAAKHAIASMHVKTAALLEEKDEALTRANTLENAKESWQMREKTLLETIEDLTYERACSSEPHLHARLEETERMLAHEIALRAAAEDELTRYRDVAQAQLREIRASEKDNAALVSQQAIEIAVLRAQLLTVQQYNLAASTPKPRKTASTFRKFWRRRRKVELNLGISSSSSSRTIPYTF